MTEPINRWTTVETIGKGVRAAPALRIGFFTTLGLAMLGSMGRVVIPILVQQAIDRGLSSKGIHVDVVITLGLIALGAITVSTIAQRTAVYRLGRQIGRAHV